jgi:hypothetical protein
MIVPDVNLLIYAYASGSLYHAKARPWWEGLLNGAEPVGLAWVVIYGFIRLMTSLRVLESPIEIGDALSIVDSWLRRPQVLVLSPGSSHMELLTTLLRSSGGGSNLITDAAIAAIALEYKATIHSNDVDFLRFEGVVVENPLKALS